MTDPPIKKEGLTEEKLQLPTEQSDVPVILPSSLPHPTPVLSAACSISATSTPIVESPNKSVSEEIKSIKSENNGHEDEDEDGDADEEDSEEMVAADDNKSVIPPVVKRERRKTGSRKAISREFIESDEDSPEDPGASNDSTPVENSKAIEEEEEEEEEEKASNDSTPSETADDDDPVDKSDPQDSTPTTDKQFATLHSSGLSKLKGEEDLDVNIKSITAKLSCNLLTFYHSFFVP